MKNRIGFVSNSSSTSFVVLLPENFDIKTVDFSLYQDIMDDYETDTKQCMKAFRTLLKDKYYDEQENYGEFRVLEKILCDKGFVIKTINCGGGEGTIVIVDINDVKKILGLQS